VKLVRNLAKLALVGAAGLALTACVYEPAPYAYAPAAPAYGYAYAPAPAYYGPAVVVGGGYYRGGWGGHWR
jgi:hypothetical protein